MNVKKTLAAISLAVGLCASIVSCGEENSSNIETGTIVGESQSILFNSKELFMQNLDNMSTVDVMKILANPYEYSNEECIKAAYDYLSSKNIDLEDVKDTLETIIVYNNHPMGLTDEEYASVLGVLGKDLPQNINGFAAFYPLAIAYHELDCIYDHRDNTCVALDNLWAAIGPISGEDIMESKFSESYAYQKIKLAMKFDSSLSMNDYINELISLSMISLDENISEEDLRMSYPALSEALGAGEYMLDTFYDLAKLTGELFLPEGNDMTSSFEDFGRNISK